MFLLSWNWKIRHPANHSYWQDWQADVKRMILLLHDTNEENIFSNQPDETKKLTKLKKHKMIYYMFLLSSNRKIRQPVKSVNQGNDPPFVWTKLIHSVIVDMKSITFAWHIGNHPNETKNMTKLKKYKINIIGFDFLEIEKFVTLRIREVAMIFIK